MNPSKNIASFQNCGTERYKCIENKHLAAYIDVKLSEDQYTATLQYGINLRWLVSTYYTAKTKKEAVLMAFDRIIMWINGERELLDDLYIPDILRPYKLPKKVEYKEAIKKQAPIQLSLF